MKTSIATVCLSGTLEEKMQACAAAGFDGIENLRNRLGSLAVLARRNSGTGPTLRTASGLISAISDLEGVTEELFEKNLHRLEAKSNSCSSWAWI